MVAEISWSKNCAIMEKCKEPLEREFYIKTTKRYGWTKDVLINNIENKAFQKYLTNQTNFDETLPDIYKHQAKLAVKDDYNFDFIEMGIEHSEAELESGIVNNIRSFLIEMAVISVLSATNIIWMLPMRIIISICSFITDGCAVLLL